MGTGGKYCLTGGKGAKQADMGFQQSAWYLAVWGNHPSLFQMFQLFLIHEMSVWK